MYASKIAPPVWLHQSDIRARVKIDRRTIALDVLIVVGFLLLICFDGLVLKWVVSFLEGMK